MNKDLMRPIVKMAKAFDPISTTPAPVECWERDLEDATEQLLVDAGWLRHNVDRYNKGESKLLAEAWKLAKDSLKASVKAEIARNESFWLAK